MPESPATGVAAAAAALRKSRETTAGIAAKVAKTREADRPTQDLSTAQPGAQP